MQAHQRHRPEFLARNEAFHVRFFSLQSIARVTFLRACRKETNVGQLQGEGSQKKTKRQRGSCCCRSERWNYRTEVV